MKKLIITGFLLISLLIFWCTTKVKTKDDYFALKKKNQHRNAKHSAKSMIHAILKSQNMLQRNNYYVQKNNFSSVLLIFLLSFSSVYAHLDGGKDKTIDSYLIDFGFSPEIPKVTDKVTLALNLINDTTKAIIVPTSVWIRISSSKSAYFADRICPEYYC